MPKNNSTKEIKMRSCVSCREVRHKSEFLRVVKTPEGEFIIDKFGKSAGRGAYICKSKSCAEIAKKRRQFDRAFKMKVPDEIYEKIFAEIEEVADE